MCGKIPARQISLHRMSAIQNFDIRYLCKPGKKHAIKAMVLTFLHHRRWIWLGIKSISNELDTDFHVLASQLSHHAMHLWRNHQSIVTSLAKSKQSGRHTGGANVIVFLSLFIGSLYRVRNKQCMYCRDEVLMHSLEGYVGAYITNTQITLKWAHKQFATPVHPLFFIYM